MTVDDLKALAATLEKYSDHMVLVHNGAGEDVLTVRGVRVLVAELIEMIPAAARWNSIEGRWVSGQTTLDFNEEGYPTLACDHAEYADEYETAPTIEELMAKIVAKDARGG